MFKQRIILKPSIKAHTKYKLVFSRERRCQCRGFHSWHTCPQVHLFTQNIQARTRRDDTRLANANLKMNTNSPFDGGNNWACVVEERREQAKGTGSVIEALKGWIPLVPGSSAREQKEGSKTNTYASISRVLPLFGLAKETVPDWFQKKGMCQRNASVMSDRRQRITKKKKKPKSKWRLDSFKGCHAPPASF